MSEKICVGRVTNVFRNKRCVAIRVEDGDIVEGDILQFVKGDWEKEIPGSYNSRHVIDSIQIDKDSVFAAKKGDHCAVKINFGQLPPNNAQVLVVGRAS